MSAITVYMLVLASQVMLLSWYLPHRIQGRIRFVYDNYPASEYPILYPKGQEQAEKSLTRMIRFNQIMLVIGLLLLAWVFVQSELFSGGIAMAVAFVYGMLQAIPIIVIDLSSLRHCKQLREEDERTKRSANLKPRSIFNHISGGVLLVALGFFLGASLFDMYTKNFDFSQGVELFEAFLILLGTNLFFAFIVRWRVYGKKLNPYQDDNDHKREVDIVVKSSVFTSIMVSLFFIAMRAVNVYDLEQFEGVIMSIYMQLIMGASMLYAINNFDLKNMNFEAYRAENRQA